jgi:hypothetical protein
MGRASLVAVLVLGLMIALLGALDTVGEAVWEERGGVVTADVRRAPADDIPSGSELDLTEPPLTAWPTR